MTSSDRKAASVEAAHTWRRASIIASGCALVVVLALGHGFCDSVSRAQALSGHPTGTSITRFIEEFGEPQVDRAPLATESGQFQNVARILLYHTTPWYGFPFHGVELWFDADGGLLMNWNVME